MARANFDAEAPPRRIIQNANAKAAGLNAYNQISATVMRFGAFGDMVMLMPMLQWITKTTGRPVGLVSSGGWTVPLMQPQPYVESIQLLTSRKAPYIFNRSQRALVQALRHRHQQPLLLCETDKKSLYLAQRSKPDALFRTLDIPKGADEHWLEYWLRFAHKVFDKPFNLENTIQELRSGYVHISEDAKRDCAEWLVQRGWSQRDIVLIQAGNKRTMRKGPVQRETNVKYWPDENWVAVAQHVLNAMPEAQVLFCGSPEEHAYTQQIVDRIQNPRVASIANELPITRLLALQQTAHSMISVDTGPAHSAAAVGCPVAVLFGQMDPRVWRPYAVMSPVHVIRNGEGQPIRGIRVEQVTAAWDALNAASAINGISESSF